MLRPPVTGLQRDLTKASTSHSPSPHTWGEKPRAPSTLRVAQLLSDRFQLRDEIIDQYDDIARVEVQIVQAGDDQDLARALSAQRIAMVDQLCSLADQLSRSQSIEPGVDRIIREEC